MSYRLNIGLVECGFTVQALITSLVFSDVKLQYQLPNSTYAQRLNSLLSLFFSRPLLTVCWRCLRHCVTGGRCCYGHRLSPTSSWWSASTLLASSYTTGEITFIANCSEWSERARQPASGYRTNAPSW